MRPWTRVPAQRALPDPACSLTRLLRPCAPPAPTHPPLAGSRHIPRLPFVVHALASHLPFLCRLPGGAGVRVFVRCKRQGRLARAALRRRSRSAAVPPRRRPLPARHPCSTPARHPSAQAVATYTRAIKDLDDGKLPSWTGMPAPDIGKKYWRLQPDANMRDLLLAIRADEVGWRWGGWVGGGGPPPSGWRVGGHRSAMCWCPRRVGVRRPPRGGGLGMLRTPLSRPGLPHVRQPHLLLTAPRRRQPLCTGLRARTLNQQLTPAALCCSVFNPLAPRARERPPPGPPYFVSSFLRRWLCARVPREAWRLPLPPLAHPPPPRAV